MTDTFTNHLVDNLPIEEAKRLLGITPPTLEELKDLKQQQKEAWREECEKYFEIIEKLFEE